MIGAIDNILRPVLARRGKLDLPAVLIMISMFGGTALYYPPPALADRLAAIDRVTPDDLIATARRVIAPAGLVLAAVGALSKARVGELREVLADWT